MDWKSRMKIVGWSALVTVFAQPVLADDTNRSVLAAGLAEDRPVIVAAQDRHGHVDIESAIEIEAAGADELVDIGSITKTVTAIATLHLIEDLGLSPQTTLAELLPEVPDDKALITLHHLLTHTSGMLESTGDDAEALSRSDFLDRVLAAPLEAEPGEVHSYSNAGYSLVAAIIELQVGMAYEDYIIQSVLPQGAPSIGYAAAYVEDRSIVSDRLWMTSFQRKPVAEASWGSTEPGWNLIGNGGLVTTPEGFLTLWTAFIDGEIVGEDLVAAAITPHVDEGEGDTFYGYGLVVEPQANGETVYWHDGGNDIFSAEWRHSTATGLTLFSAGTGEAAFDAMAAMMDNT